MWEEMLWVVEAVVRVQWTGRRHDGSDEGGSGVVWVTCQNYEGRVTVGGESRGGVDLTGRRRMSFSVGGD